MTQSNIKTCYELLQCVLSEAFQTDCVLFSPPYNDFSLIDHGIRKIMWPDYKTADMSQSSTMRDPAKRFFIIKSNLGFFNIIAYLTTDEHPDFISIGPFRSEEFTKDYFPHIAKDIGLTQVSTLPLKSFYDNLPYIALSSITNIVKGILSNFFSEFESMAPLQIAFQEESHTIKLDSDLLQEYTAEFADDYQKSLLNFLSALKKGDVSVAQKELKTFLSKISLASFQNISEYQRELNVINNLCHAALMDTAIHPIHVLKLYNSFRQKISAIHNRDTLIAMPNDICHKYCLLVRNYAYPEYSQTTRAVINYINLHLEEDLSLSLLASYFRKNASSLSATFSREVGISVTNFIHQTRINEAIRYFNSTEMSVSEVALTVGFQDFAYFSRLFRKQVGCSPREYCANIR